jgi:hypothetical protein
MVRFMRDLLISFCFFVRTYMSDAIPAAKKKSKSKKTTDTFLTFLIKKWLIFREKDDMKIENESSMWFISDSYVKVAVLPLQFI